MSKRIFNAALALDLDVKNLTENVDSISSCLSKGLSCPVGSIICGRSEFISKARHIRKGLGGGMRQAGVFAAAGILALDEMIIRLKEDHLNAKYFSKGLSKINGIEINPEDIESNILIFSLTKISSHEFTERLSEMGIYMLPWDDTSIRAVTNLMVDKQQIQEVLKKIGEVLSK